MTNTFKKVAVFGFFAVLALSGAPASSKASDEIQGVGVTWEQSQLHEHQVSTQNCTRCHANGKVSTDCGTQRQMAVELDRAPVQPQFQIIPQDGVYRPGSKWR